MPQLDKLTFTTQIFWLFITFFSLYWVVTRKILPTILSITRTRQLLLSKMTTFTAQTGKESVHLDKVNSDFYIATTENLLTYMKYLDSVTSSWYRAQSKRPHWITSVISINRYLYALSRIY